MAKESKIKFNVEEMAQAGLHFGHMVSKLHPRMKPFVSGIKNNVHMIDLDQTAKHLEVALHYIASLVSEGKSLLCVGTKVQYKALVKTTAENCRIPYVTERWLGGTFTNFETIVKRVQYFKELEHKISTGELEKYTKKERALFDKELTSLRAKFEGIRSMNTLPQAVLVLDVKKDLACVREARRKGIKVIGLIDTNIDPRLVDYPIPANDDSLSSVSYILNAVQEAILNAR